MERKVEFLTVDMADEISDLIERRQEKFDEPLDVSIKVVILNYGDRRRIAHCIRGDWSGPKSELIAAPSGLPLCPQCGKPCTEEALGWRLGLIREQPGEDQWGITQVEEADDED